MKENKYELNPFTLDINKKTIAETAFQRAIWLCKQSQLNHRTITWLDIELPVDERICSRGKCVDLIGIEKATNRYVLCELKFRRKSDHGSPTKAIRQILEYRDAIIKNKEILKDRYHHKNCTAPFDWREIASSNPLLIVAANAKYWSEHRPIKEIDEVECYSLDVPPDTFEKESRKASGKSYRPFITPDQNKWRKVTPQDT